ncbi:MAG: hypothetical protein AAB533_01205 [Patescibacteria group bacterium]
MQRYTSTIPKWAQETMPRATRPVSRLFKSIAFLKMKEYERQTQTFEERHQMPFLMFEKKIGALKKEDAAAWDDYLVWKGLEAAREKWRKRYEQL